MYFYAQLLEQIFQRKISKFKKREFKLLKIKNNNKIKNKSYREKIQLYKNKFIQAVQKIKNKINLHK